MIARFAAPCDVGFKGSRGDGVHIWKEAERAELDAAYFHLYGISRDDAAYILSTFTNTGWREPATLRADQSPWTPGQGRRAGPRGVRPTRPGPMTRNGRRGWLTPQS